MLINCPKCGFSQPKDKYCASCGVDMDSYKPVAPSLLKSLLGNPFFHLSLVGVLAFGSWVMIRQNQQRELKNRIEYLQSGPLVIERSDGEMNTADQSLNASAQTVNPEEAANEGSEQSLTESQERTAAPAAAAEKAGGSPAPTNAASNFAIESQTTSTANNGPGNDKTESKKLTLMYAEIDQASMESLIREAQKSGQFNRFGDAFWGVIPEVDRKLTSMRSLRTLGRDEKSLDAENTAQWFVGGHTNSDSEMDPGLMIFVQALDGENGQKKVEVEVQRSFREVGAGTNLLKKSFPAAFELRAGQGFMMGGILPRQIEQGSDLESPTGFFQIFKSAQYRSKQSEFTLIFQFDTN